MERRRNGDPIANPGMTRLARDRDTHLTREEIAAEALRCFDESAVAPSIRQLASVLRVTPSAIYHHFPSRAAIIQAAVDLVWEEAGARFLQLVPDPLTADPVEVLVAGGVATREVFGTHYQVAPFIAATKQASGPLTTVLALMATIFKRMGLDRDEAAASFHTYASYTLGAVLFAATRRITNEQLAREGAAAIPPERYREDRSRRADGQRDAGATGTVLVQALDEMVDLSVVDPDRDGKLFAEGLRRLITTMSATN
jgi:AcrR family transcriptional regulator